MSPVLVIGSTGHVGSQVVAQLRRRQPYSRKSWSGSQGDIAAIGVRALCENGHAGAEYVLTGPESLTQREQISIIGSLLGRSLHIEEMTPDEARKELVSVMDWGMAPATSVSAVIEKLLSAWGAAVGLPAFVSTTFAEITGTRPRTFRHWASDHAGKFLGLAGTAA